MHHVARVGILAGMIVDRLVGCLVVILCAWIAWLAMNGNVIAMWSIILIGSMIVYFRPRA